jgi:hypothetical protein
MLCQRSIINILLAIASVSLVFAQNDQFIQTLRVVESEKVKFAGQTESTEDTLQHNENKELQDKDADLAVHPSFYSKNKDVIISVAFILNLHTTSNTDMNPFQ